MTKPLSAADQDYLDEKANAFTSIGSSTGKELGSWQGLGEASKAFLSPSASAATALGVAASAPAVLWDYGKSAITGKKSTEAGDAMFRNVVDPYGRDVEKYWRPDPNAMGEAARVSSMAFQLGGTLPQIFAMPEVALGGMTISPTMDAVDQGVSSDGLYKIGAINLATNGVAWALPPAWGRTLLGRVSTGAGANALAGAVQEGATGAILRSENNSYAEAYDWANLENRLFEAGVGAIFGGKVHYDAINKPMQRMPTKDEQAAVFTELNQDHLANQTLPGLPISKEGFKQHTNAIDTAIQAVLRGERADVAAAIDLNSFLIRPELRPADYVPSSSTGKTAGNYGAGFLVDPEIYGNFSNYRIALESGGRADAKAATSSATGLQQFTDDTWLSLVQKHRPAWAKGLGRQQILDTRTDPEISTDMVKLLDQELVTGLANAGLPINFHTMYAMHHFNPASGKKFAAAAGDTPMSEILRPAELKANPYLRSLTKDQATAVWDKRAKKAGAPVDTLIVDAQKPAAPDPMAAPEQFDAEAAMARYEAEQRMDAPNFGMPEPTRSIDDADPFWQSIPEGKDGRETFNIQTPEREAMREQMVDEHFAGKAPPRELAPGERPIAYVMGGGGASGKGTILRDLHDTGMIPKNLVHIDPDAIKAGEGGISGIPEYRTMKERGDSRAAAVVHEESSSIAAKAKARAIAEGRDFVLDRTLGDPAKAIKELQELAKTHEIRLYGVTIDPGTAIDRAVGRAKRSGRFVPLDKLLKAHKGFADGFEQYLSLVDQAILFDNSGDIHAAIATAAGGKLDISDQKAYNDFATRRALNETASTRRQLSEVPAGDTGANASGEVSTGSERAASSSQGQLPAGAGSPGRNESPASGSLGRVQRTGLSAEAFPLQGNETTVTTERGADYPVRYVLVDMAELVTSHTDALTVNPDYPAELQPRDRARAASEQQITRIANDIKPELLAESPKAADGAPIIGQDKVVESGNARTIALRRAYDAGNAEKYRQFLKDNAERYGLDPAAVDGLERPVLARVALAEYNRAEFARQANESTVASMSTTEQAMADAARMPDMGGLVPNEDGTINMRASGDFVRQFIEGVGPNERAAMSTADGSMSQQGQARIRNAVFAKAYGDADLVAMMTEATDANVKNVLAGMLRAAPRIARLRELIAEGHRYGPDFAPDLVAAARKFSQLRSDGFTVEQFEAQGDMFGDAGLSPKAMDLLRTIGENARAPKRMAEFLQQMVEATDAMGDPMQAALFGDAGANVDDVIRVAAERTRAANQEPDQPMLIAENVAEGYDLFGAPVPDPKPARVPKFTKTVPTYQGQPDLFTLPEGFKDGEVQKETADGWRQDASPETMERAFNSLGALVRRYSGSILHQRIADGYSKGKANLLIGQKISSHEDIAALLQQYRNPHFETLRYVFTDDAGTVLGETAVSQRLPGSSAVWPTEINRGNSKDAAADWLQGHKDALGATQLWISHNHPSGTPTPSTADYTFSKQFAPLARKAGFDYKGHIVTNHKTYHVINPDNSNFAGKLDGADGADPQKTGNEVRPQSFGMNGMAGVIRNYTDGIGDNDAMILAVDASGEVTAIITVPVSELKKAATASIPALKRRTRAAYLFLAGKGGVEKFVGGRQKKKTPFDDVFIEDADGKLSSARGIKTSPITMRVPTKMERSGSTAIREPGIDYNKPKPEIPEFMAAPEEMTPEQMMVLPRAEAEQLARTREAELAEYEKQRNLRQKALSAVAKWNLQRTIAAYPAPPMVALDRILARTGKVQGNVLSVESQAKAVRADAYRQLVDTLQATAPKFFGLLENMDGVRSLVMELHGQDSGNPAAKRGAQAFRKVTDQLRERFNRAGGDIGKLDDWGMPHHHSQLLVAKAGREKWVNDILPRLNRERYAMNDRDLRKLLENAWDTIATNGVNKQTPGQFTGAGKVANHGAEARQIHFRDGDAYLEYQKQYGESSPYETITGHINGIAHDIALIEAFGPNPDQMFRELKDAAYKQTVEQDPANLDKHDKQAAWLDTLFREVSGKGKPVANRNLARAFDEWRSLMVASKLGSATITALTDHGTMHTAATAAGLPQMQLLANELAAFNPANANERAQINRMGLGLATLIGETNRFGNDVVASGIFNRLGSAVLRVSGLQASTDARRRAYGVTMMDAIGALTNKHESLADLDPMDNRVLLSKGVTETDFAVWKLAQKDDLGANHSVLHPDAIYAISDEALRPLAERLFMDADLDKLRQDAVTKLLGAVLEEVDMGVIEPGARERALMHGDRVRGTWKGELMATVMLFKSFPVAMITKHWQRMASMPTPAQKGQYAAMLLASTTVMGMMAMQIANMLQGKDPADMTDSRSWVKALLKGGGLSLFGDFAFNDSTQFGSSFLAAVGGPGASTIEEVAGLTLGNMHQAARGEKTHVGAEMVKFAKGNTPFANLWYTRAATDHLIIHELQEMASPGYLRKMEKRARKEYGETYFWKPGEAAPDRAPDLDKAVGE